MSVLKEVISFWSEKFRISFNDLASSSDYLLFTTAYLTSSGLRTIGRLGRFKKIVGIVRSYGNILKGNIAVSSGNIKYLPGLHSKIFIFISSELKPVGAIIWSGNITKRSIFEELNHFVVTSDRKILSKLIDDYDILLKYSSDSNADGHCPISLKVLNKSGFDQIKLNKLANDYLSGKVSIEDAINLLNFSTPLYQVLFCFKVAKKVKIHSFIFEPQTLRSLLYPIALSGVDIVLYTLPRPTVSYIRWINKRIREEGGKEIIIEVMKGLHTKTIIVESLRGDKFAYVGSATLSRSALYYEINHGIFTLDRGLIRELEAL